MKGCLPVNRRISSESQRQTAKTVKTLWPASLLALVALLIAWLGLLASGCSGLPTRLYHQFLLAEDFASKDIKFKPQMAGNGRTPEGTGFDFQMFRASDCVKVTVTTRSEGSDDRAEQELEKLILTASQVVERGPKDNRDGKPVGKRAILLFANAPKRAVIVWTAGLGSLITVESSSLAHAVEYERRVNLTGRY
jgi:hypothetical protein